MISATSAMFTRRQWSIYFFAVLYLIGSGRKCCRDTRLRRAL
ncbi:hypothetical protein MANES_09G148650v8 [Manihot esculenta]|uniref:Uncharacterized protein n=1 Tax=Manihot esculenta TaxID=3983 RepID=A0ACB7HB39_MANES|nr:hypothetical protein MANES_09G148650v8 [Manihot esculenta]